MIGGILWRVGGASWSLGWVQTSFGRMLEARAKRLALPVLKRLSGTAPAGVAANQTPPFGIVRGVASRIDVVSEC
eukprot:5069191-Pyramimonas_sp.AAC.1